MTAISSTVARAVLILGTAITVPFALDYLGTERYGVWLTISSFVGLLAFADLGLGNGLLTAVSKSQGRDDSSATRDYVASGFFMLLGAALVLAVAFVLLWSIIDWRGVFNLTSEVKVSETESALLVFAVLFIVAIPLRLTEKVQWALQEGYIAGVWQAVGALLSVVGILAAIWLGGDLKHLSLALVGGPLIAAAGNWAITFGRRHRELLPRRMDVSTGSTRELLRLGSVFFGLQIAVAIAFVSDNLVVAHVLGPEHVPQLAVPFQMFAAVSVLVSLMLTPLWPAYGESFGRGDYVWVKATFRRSLTLSLGVTIVGAALLIVIGPWVVRVWAGPEIVVETSLLLGLAVLTVLTASGNAIAMFLNGVGLVRLQLIAAAVMAPTALVLKILLAPSFGVAGVVWGTVASYAIFTLAPLSVYTRHIIRRLDDRHVSAWSAVSD